MKTLATANSAIPRSGYITLLQILESVSMMGSQNGVRFCAASKQMVQSGFILMTAVAVLSNPGSLLVCSG